MATLTMADVAQYFVAFQTKNGFPCTLSVDDMEQILEGTEDDDEDIIIAAMADAMKPDADETGTDPDRSMPIEVKAGSGWSFASRLDDKVFREHLETNAEAALENKRGAAVIGNDLIRIFTREAIIGVFPIIGSTPKTHPNANRPTHKYDTLVKDTATGEDKPGTGDWYADLFDGSQEGKDWKVQSDSLKAAKAGEKGKHVLAKHAAMEGDEVALIAERSYLDTFRTNKKNAIVRAINLIQRMARINEETEAVCRIVTQDGSPTGEPARSNKLVFIKNTKDETKFRVLTIGQALGLDIDKAKASQLGATYQALIGTKKRKPKTTAGVQDVKIETIPQYDNVTAEYAHFFEKLRTDTKAMNAFLTHLNGAGSDDLLMSMNGIMTDIDSYLSKPAYQKRLALLLTTERDGVKKAVA